MKLWDELISESNGLYIYILSTHHQHVFDRARTRELPGSYPFVVQQTFIDGIIKQWNAPAQILCKTVYSILTEHIRRLVGIHFSSFGQGGLEQRVRSVHRPCYSIYLAHSNL